MPPREIDVIQGTLDLLVLKTLTWGPMHGYNVLGWLRRVTDGALAIEEGALYPALHRLERRRAVESEWGLSENNRRAKFYRLTPTGRRELRAEAAAWQRYAALIAKVLAVPAPGVA